MKKEIIKKTKMYVLALVLMLGSAPAMQVGAQTTAARAVNAATTDAEVKTEGLKEDNLKAQVMAASTAKTSSTTLETSAQKPLKELFKYAKSADKQKIKKYVKDASLIDGDIYFSDSATNKVSDYVRAENKKRFSYTILNTVIAKDKASATIKVKVNYRSLYNASCQATLSVLRSWETYYQKHGEDPEDEYLGSLFISSFKKGIKKYPAKATSKTFVVKVRKYGSTWKLTSVTENLLNACFCNMDKGYYRALEISNE